jgi:EAL domain-containing protein (putative c-di-GMP-specific phosphodiesterase class I)
MNTVPESAIASVMVIDDDPLTCALIINMLKKLGMTQVTAYEGGHTALQSLGAWNHASNLILLDLDMPEMDGVEFVRHLVARSYAGSLILISGLDARILRTAENWVRTNKINILGSMHKPIYPESLADLLGRWTPYAGADKPVAKKIYGPDDLQAAFANGELINYYQPKIAVASGEVVGVEALIRWHHPRDGVVFPDQFVGLVETHGLMDRLTRKVLTDALAHLQAWNRLGLRLQIAINVAMTNLESLDFADFVTSQAASAGVAPERVVLEVSENRLQSDSLRSFETLARLCLKKFRLSIDDFGTGRSFLVQLRDMSFDELKIDRGFVHRAWADETIRAIYDASLRLARQLELDAVAEGVEDGNDWDFVRKTGCDFAQGNFIAMPMPANDLPDWIRSWQRRMGKTNAAEG